MVGLVGLKEDRTVDISGWLIGREGQERVGRTRIDLILDPRFPLLPLPVRTVVAVVVSLCCRFMPAAIPYAAVHHHARPTAACPPRAAARALRSGGSY